MSKTNNETMCVLSNLSGDYLISVDDATTLFGILSRARRVQHTYGSGYSFCKPDDYYTPTLKLLDSVALSKIAMNSD